MSLRNGFCFPNTLRYINITSYFCESCVILENIFILTFLLREFPPWKSMRYVTRGFSFLINVFFQITLTFILTETLSVRCLWSWSWYCNTFQVCHVSSFEKLHLRSHLRKIFDEVILRNTVNSMSTRSSSCE